MAKDNIDMALELGTLNELLFTIPFLIKLL